ncbi:MAG TPA: CRTAC1 family protein, partial [Saprospiraceae bacterium]|nr:CRTAC1 family protein [Saprospiraceae bacterium]
MIPQPTYQAGLIFLFVFMMMGCLHLHKQNPLFEALSPEHTGIDFVNILAEADTFSIIDYIYYYNGGGVGIADFNGDGLEDIIFTANETSIRLYLNQGDFIFTDVTEIAGVTTNTWVTGINIADINGDGWPDFYLCVAGSKHADKRKNLLFIHAGFDEAGIPYFTEQADDWGVADTGYSTQSVFFDFNNDGLLDLFVMNHANNKSVVNNPLPLKWDEPGESNDRLYRNNGNGTFTDVTIESGIIGEGYGLGVCIHDFNGDGWPDIYVANDFIYNDHLWINQGNGTFINESSLWLPVQSYNSMGCDMADLNHSGFQDLLVLDMMPLTWKDYKLMTGTMTWAKWNIMMTQGYSPQYMRNTLFKNNGIVPGDSGGYPFFEIAHYARIARTDWSWAPLFADFDNDGYSDLYISNGYYRDITDQDFTDYTGHLIYFSDQERSNQQIWEEVKKRNGLHTPNRMFNNKRNYRFEDMTGHWIHSHPSFSNGAAYVDLNNDGFPDLVVNNINEKATLYRNNGSNEKHSGNYIQIHLNGPKENKTGIGTKLVCKTASFQQTLYQYPVRGFQSSVSAKLHFGLGDEAVIQELSIVWPDGKQQTLKDIPANQLISIFYENAMELKANNAHSTSPPP